MSFAAISERGDVFGAMDTMYQRGKIQQESLYYEHKAANIGRTCKQGTRNDAIPWPSMFARSSLH